MYNYIAIRGAKEHNLKNINIDIPKNCLVVITGVSGSGKSSLAFDTIYAEGQRRYVESLSSYARQFLEMHSKPDVESIEGLSPAIAIDQKTASRNPRSTVATATEIYDYLRVLFARIGVPYSPTTGLPIKKQTPTQMVDALMELPEKTTVILLAPLVCGHKGEYKKELLHYCKLGYKKFKIDDHYYDSNELPIIDRNKKHRIELVVDQVTIENTAKEKLFASVEKTLKIGKGQLCVEIEFLPKGHRTNKKVGEAIIFSEKFSCLLSRLVLPEIEPRIFSFNSPYGACPQCNGLGKEKCFDEKLIIPDPSLSLSEGAVVPWQRKNSKYSNIQYKFYENTFKTLSKHYKFSLEEPFENLPKQIQNIILYGSGDEVIEFSYQEGYKTLKFNECYRGIIPILEAQLQKTESNSVIEELSRYQTRINCNECSGYRIKKSSLCVRINKLHIGEVSEFTIEKVHDWCSNLPKTLSPTHATIAKVILTEIKNRSKFLMDVGLQYLTLNRSSSTLSGGEGQRIRLASQIGSNLTGVLYVLDEPSIGLHQSDNEKLINSLKKLKDLGNSVILVEHDEDTMRHADHLIDIGKYAGADGGRVIAQGTSEEISKNKESITGNYLSSRYFISVPKKRRKYDKTITMKNVKTNNLKNISVDIPIMNFVAVTGVSGSGKSSLILQTLYGVLLKKLHNGHRDCGQYGSIHGIQNVDKVIEIDQQPIGKSPRSNPATYTGVFAPIRDWYAGLRESKLRGYLPGRFSFNVKGGRCEVCEGDGVLKVEMHFLPNVYIKCHECQGKRYNKETLEIEYNGKTISDVLEMTVDEGIKFFENLPLINDKLKALRAVGLGYISIGQSAITLSGGEAQRIKLAKELSRKSTGRTVYILDEPTTGLHSHDIQNLLKVLHELVDVGNTVIVIEHNLDIIKTADYMIDIGPQGGNKGGEIIAQGTPEEVSKNPNSITGKYLANKLDFHSIIYED